MVKDCFELRGISTDIGKHWNLIKRMRNWGDSLFNTV